MEFLSKNLEETAKIAFDFAKSLDGAHERDKTTVVGLYGDLGAGKTSFMKFIAKEFGIEEEIKSPTFVIMKIYDIAGKSEDAKFFNFSKLIHIDAYRIEDSKEMEVLGWEKIISDPQNLIFVEWPEKIAEIMPPHTKIFFEHISETERKIKIKNEKGE